jgi:putative tryptophan/tyrosine transport system substrate-binding protein
MKRRVFTIGGAAAFWSLAASAQEPGRTYRLGGLFPSPREAPQNLAMFEGLRRSGFIEGQNLTIDWRGYGQSIGLVSEFAAELVKERVDVIAAGGDFGIRAAQQATATIPIVGFTDDMLGSQLVNSLSRPGGNTTGISLLATELDGKRQEILIEAVPGLRRMAAFADSGTTSPRQLQALQDAARARSIELSIHQVAKAQEIAPAIDAAKASDAAAINILAWPRLSSSLIARSSLSALRRCACQQFTNGRKWQRKEASSGTARASSSSFGICWPGSSSRFYAAPNPPICRSSNRPTSSWSSISRPRRR